VTLARLLNYPITLVARSEGPEDAWGSPTEVDTLTEALCYYRQDASTDSDEGGTTTDQTLTIFLAPDVQMSDVDAVVLDGVEYEVVGEPDRELNARLGKVNHLAVRVRMAVA